MRLASDVLARLPGCPPHRRFRGSDSARAPWREATLWALAASTVVMWVAALVAVVMMEERDYIAVETLYPAASDPVEAGVPDAAIEEPLAQAA